jgi:hypothetical protein
MIATLSATGTPLNHYATKTEAIGACIGTKAVWAWMLLK